MTDRSIPGSISTLSLVLSSLSWSWPPLSPLLLPPNKECIFHTGLAARESFKSASDSTCLLNALMIYSLRIKSLLFFTTSSPPRLPSIYCHSTTQAPFLFLKHTKVVPSSEPQHSLFPLLGMLFPAVTLWLPPAHCLGINCNIPFSDKLSPKSFSTIMFHTIFSIAHICHCQKLSYLLVCVYFLPPLE